MGYQWLVAKYMEDLRRREPRNVGVVLFVEGQVHQRFVGQREDGSIDGRRAKFPSSLATYKAWVDYWLRTLDESGEDSLDRGLLEQSTDQNYFLEIGGRTMADRSDADPTTLLDELYRQLVEEPPQPDETQPVGTIAKRLFAQLGIANDVKQNVEVKTTIRDKVDVVTFDYEYINGARHLMRNVRFTPTWTQLHAAVWSFEAAHKADSASQFVAFARPEEATDERQFELLERFAHVVDVDAESAAENLGEVLHVA